MTSRLPLSSLATHVISLCSLAPTAFSSLFKLFPELRKCPTCYLQPEAHNACLRLHVRAEEDHPYTCTEQTPLDDPAWFSCFLSLVHVIDVFMSTLPLKLDHRDWSSLESMKHSLIKTFGSAKPLGTKTKPRKKSRTLHGIGDQCDERSTSPSLGCMNSQTLVLAALVKISAN